MDLYIAPDGNDQWSGGRAGANASKTDGPLATLAGARDLLRAMRAGIGGVYQATRTRQLPALHGPVTVHLRGGVYPITTFVVFGPGDSWPVTFKAYKNEKPVISGARRIRGWEVGTLNGRTVWSIDLPDVAAGRWSFRQLFVNGRRASRPRAPARGLFRMKQVPDMPEESGWGRGGYTRFVCADGDVMPWRNLADAEIVYVHFWIEERSPIESFDPATNMVTMTRPSRAPLVGSHGRQLTDYYVDNVFEALCEPGQWYLDRPTGRLTYIPRRGETPETTEVYAPCVLQLLKLVGMPEKERYVEHLRFEGLTFAHTDWRHPSHDGTSESGAASARPSTVDRYSRGGDAAASQAACDVPGVVVLEGARHCAIEDCTIRNIGWYGIELADGCRNIHVIGNTIRDMGAGGVKLNGADAAEPRSRQTGLNRITDNHIVAGGRVFHSAVGILSMHSFGNVISFNHIHDLYYTGISCGWVWGYRESVSRDNRIEYNHIHDLGQKLLSDMGGIYTLGVQPGTTLRWNLIHDVTSAHYGGWCIYPDEGSSHLLIENNICHDADRQPFHQHYGRENVVRNNILCFGGEAVGRYTRLEPHRGFTFERNILLTKGQPIWSSSCGPEQEATRMICDLNLFWDVSGARPFFEVGGKRMALKQWRELGYDRHSIVADPMFVDLAGRDLELKPESPAITRLGFRPIVAAGVGPRPASKRTAD